MTISRLGCQAWEEGLVPEAELPKENTCKERFAIGKKKKKKKRKFNFSKQQSEVAISIELKCVKLNFNTKKYSSSAILGIILTNISLRESGP